MPDQESSDHRSTVQRIYEDHYKKLMILPFLLVVLSLIQIGHLYYTQGEFFHSGVSLKGGVSVTITDVMVDPALLIEHIKTAFPQADIEIRRLTQTGGVVIDVSDVEADSLLPSIHSFFPETPPEKYNVEQFGSSLGGSFFSQTIKAMILAFLFMAIVVFIVFRRFWRGLAIILAVFSDIAVTMAIVNLLGMRLSAAGIAAFLMLIGYAVDTDVLLSTYVLKRTYGTVMDRIYSSMKTGLVMTSTTLTATLIGMILSKSPTITQIMTIIFIGLLVDIIMTYIQNAGLLRMMVEPQHHEHHT